MIEAILAEWFSRQTEEMRKAYDTNEVAFAALETTRASMTHLYEVLREEGVHVYHCRRIVNRMLYGTPEPEGVSTLFDHLRNVRMRGLDDSSFTLTGQLNPQAATELIKELTKADAVINNATDYGE